MSGEGAREDISFGVRPDRADNIGVALDGKIKAPTSIDPSLPEVALLIREGEGRKAKIAKRRA